MSENGATRFEAFSTYPQQLANLSSENSGSTKSSKEHMEPTTNIPMCWQASIGEKRCCNEALKPSISKVGVEGYSGEVKMDSRDPETHAFKERERWKKLIDKFDSLRGLLPQLLPKADKSTVVNTAVNYIKKLEQDLDKLIKKKEERINGDKVPTVTMMNQNNTLLAASSSEAVSVSQFPHCFKTWSSPNVVLNIIGEEAHISICTSTQPGLLTNIFYVMEKHGLELVYAQVSSNSFRSMYQIHARANGATEMIEEIFKLAVAEMLLFISIT